MNLKAMPVLTKKQIEHGYFNDIGGFPPLNETEDRTNFAVKVEDYNGQKTLCICCTQLDAYGYNEREKKRVLAEWIDFLQANKHAFTALHFNSRVPQALFDAACCQENLEELRFKWGVYSDIAAIENLHNLKFLYIGSCPSVKEITPLIKLKKLVVLFAQNFNKIEDYSSLVLLNRLEQLIISGPTLGTTPIKDFEFLRQMPNLLSFWCPNTTIRKKYTADEITALCTSVPNLHIMYSCIFK